ncbi:ATPase, T2SS/T4P/T4SS family [Aliagarivorans taiwanensis]|uniref:ATPase, T2SS/T4P/T4SS family n=1 Tax=Aliagarivorans taiwanensis TaxID=561966 RepID=UPI000411B068|nr:ATPase, T2SS/T4P/T4SS family [Aliagarivorans taiwanensis]
MNTPELPDFLADNFGIPDTPAETDPTPDYLQRLIEDPDFQHVERQASILGSTWDKLFISLERAGSFDDIYLCAEWPIVIKRKKRLYRPRAALLTQAELESFIEFKFSTNANIRLKAPSGEVKDAFEVNPASDHSLGYAAEVHKDDAERYRYRLAGSNYLTPNGYRSYRLVARSLETVPRTFDQLNVCETIRKHCSPRQGLVIIAGETGSGKSTLCASIVAHLRQLKDDYRIILSYEKPIEYLLHTAPGHNPVWQHSVGEGEDFATFYDALVNALRSGPEVIYLGETSDQDTFATLPKIAESGHMGLTTLHAKNIPAIFTRFYNEVEPEKANAVLGNLVTYAELFVVQYLSQAKDGGIVAVQEILHFTPSLKRRLLKHKGQELLEAVGAAVEEEGQSMTAHARALFEQGVISQAALDNILTGV